MPRFVLLTHDHPTPHWDLMIEAGAALRTWRLDADLCRATSCGVTRLADHRRHYLDYEGPVGGGRGTVARVAAGEFEWVEDSPGRTVIDVKSTGLAGRLTLVGEEASFRPTG